MKPSGAGNDKLTHKPLHLFELNFVGMCYAYLNLIILNMNVSSAITGRSFQLTVYRWRKPLCVQVPCAQALWVSKCHATVCLATQSTLPVAWSPLAYVSIPSHYAQLWSAKSYTPAQTCSSVNYGINLKYGGHVQFSNHFARMLNFCEDSEYLWANLILVLIGSVLQMFW